MSNRSNPEYLRNYQYRDAGNLNSRINLHYHFSTNPADWFRWVFDHFNLPARASVLEIGCGPARLWVGNLDRFPSAWQIFLSDFSLGMLLAARSNLVQHTFPFNYSALDAQAIPFPPATFDLVVANHMLYHVPDRRQAFSEIQRILKAGGCLIAATNGLHHMHEIQTLLQLLDPDLAARTDHAFGVSEFTIENGAAQLDPFFSEIHCDHFPDALEVTQVEPLLAYILSMTMPSEVHLSQSQVNNLTQFLESQITQHGSFHITKSTALFIAQKQ